MAKKPEDVEKTEKDTPASRRGAAKRRSSRTAAKKTAGSSATKSAKKTAKKPAKKTSSGGAARKDKSDSQDALAGRAAAVDREALGEKVRVHQLARQLEITSRELIAKLDALGIVKVAASNLVGEEIERVLSHLAGGTARPAAEKPSSASEEKKSPEGKERGPKRSKKGKKAQPPAKEPKEREEEATQDAAAAGEQALEDTDTKLRHQVRAGVKNEIHQIEEKVDKELAERETQEKDSEKLRQHVHANVKNEIHQIKEKVDSELAEALAKAEKEEDPQAVDAAPTITPAPHRQQSVPVFLAPENDDAASEDGGEGEESPEEEREDADQAASSRSKKRRRGRRSSTRGKRPAPEEKTERTGDAEDAAGDNAGEQPHRDDTTDEAPTPKPAPKPASKPAPKPGPSVAGPKPGPKPVPKPGPTRPQKEASGEEGVAEPMAVKGSTRLAAQRRRRQEQREASRRSRTKLSRTEFLARREAVERVMVVRERKRDDGAPAATQVGVLEDGRLVEHFLTSDAQHTTMIGNVYLGRVQNVLPSMEAAFVDIGKMRNGVVYASDLDWRSTHAGIKGRRIENALHHGDQVLVQVVKDPVGHKGARLSEHVSLAGRYLVYVPGGRSMGISRKLPENERKRLKNILRQVVPEDGGAIIRTAAEGVSKEAIALDVKRLHDQWEDMTATADKERESHGAKPVTLYEEPDLLVKVVRDLFNEDFTSLVVDGERAWRTVYHYVKSVSPDLLERLVHYDRAEHDGLDAFAHYSVDEQIAQGLDRIVDLPSGGSLVFDRTEAMTVIDVNTARFTGKDGNLEQTVTRNNMEAAEEIARQLRLRDIGGIVVIDFIDMVLEQNQDLVLRTLSEAMAADRSRHQISEVTSLGLVQLTRKKLGAGLADVFGGASREEDDEYEDDITAAGESEASLGEPDSGTELDERDDAARPSVSHGKEEIPDHIEELAAAVVLTDDEDDAGTDPASHAERSDGSDDASAPQRGRRGRRRATARRGRHGAAEAEGEQHAEEIADVAAAAVKTADKEDPDEPSGADYEVDYETALAEFEASPRRKRRTRGNSRSDRKPRPEDFTSPETGTPAESATEPEENLPETAVSADAHEAPTESETSSGARRARGARGRRGAVRRARRRADGARQVAEQPQEQPVAEETAKTREGDADDPSVETLTARPGRRRRRAVRRHFGSSADGDSSRRSPRDAGAGATGERRERGAEQQKSGHRRGRRRAVRRADSARHS